MPAWLIPAALGVAAFGIAKLAGASTRTSLMAGLGTFGGMSMLSAANPTMFGSMFSKNALASGAGSLPQTQLATKLGYSVGGGGLQSAAALPQTQLATQLGYSVGGGSSALGSSMAPIIEGATGAINASNAAANVSGSGIAGNLGFDVGNVGGAMKNAMNAPVLGAADAASAASPSLVNQAGDFIGNMSTAEKIGLGVGGANLLSGMMAPEPPPLKDQMPYSEEDYSAAYAREQDRLQGIGDRYAYDLAPQQDRGDIYSPINPIYANEGGLISVAKFNEGGVNYLPSKLDHDENDSNNYVRAQGYVEDSTGIGDKDEDTMLAQLADGEFVSRADAVLGAGILSGANAKSFKEMRAKGASFFYKQQKQFKRIYDIVNATDKKS